MMNFLRSDEHKNCLKLALDTENFIVSQVLIAEAVNYTFLDEKGTIININGRVAEKITSDLKSLSELKSNSSLTINKELIYGYRVFDVISKKGNELKFDLQEFDQNIALDLKNIWTQILNQYGNSTS